MIFSTNVMPTVEQLRRFLYVYPHHMASRAPGGAVHFDALYQGRENIIAVTQMRFPDFEVKPGHKRLLDATLHDPDERRNHKGRISRRNVVELSSHLHDDSKAGGKCFERWLLQLGLCHPKLSRPESHVQYRQPSR